jgi:MFS family permease
MARGSYLRNITALSLCQALILMCNMTVISTAPLVGLQYAPAPWLATLPLGAQYLGTMCATMPASLLMRHLGRRAGLSLGCMCGVLAAGLGVLAIWQASFPLFCLAGSIYGIFGAFGQYLRFAAADASDAAFGAERTASRGRAISWVLLGGLAAAFLGPALAVSTRDLLSPVIFAGCYAAIAVLASLALITLQFLDLPRPALADRRRRGRPIGVIARQPAAVTAFLAAVVAYVTMNLLMTATPLAIVACGHDFGDSAFVIQWHVVGMFAPSLVTGHLIARLGVRPVILTGVGLNILCIAVAVSGVEVADFAAALFLLGVGWNLMFIGATTLLTTCHAEAEKAQVQGLNDFLLFGCVTASATLSGALHALLGWQAMNLLALPALLLVGMMVLLRPGTPRLAPAG